MIWRAFTIENAMASSRLLWLSTRMKRCSLRPSGKVLLMTPAVFQPLAVRCGAGSIMKPACSIGSAAGRPPPSLPPNQPRKVSSSPKAASMP